MMGGVTSPPKQDCMASPATRPTLLLKIRDPNDRRSWGEFVDLYMPLLHAYAMKRGMQDADAADVAQDTVRHVIRSIQSFDYDPSRGSFRGWLLTVARNEIRRFASRRARVAIGSGDTDVHATIEQQPSRDPSPDADWDRQYQLALFRWAADRVRDEFRERTWNAFWWTIVEQQSIETVSANLQLSVGAVYIARSRILARIREMIQSVDGELPR
jgi:RNA polymerase sigma factor (sigma-70 family)